MTTTWSTTDKSAGATLSGGNLVVSFSSGSPGVRSLDRVYTGKYYWELTFTTTANASVGITTGTASLTGIGSGAIGSLSAMVGNGGTYFNNSSSLGSLGGTFGAGWVVCCAVDAGGGLVWFRNGASGNWNGNAANNPATGTGGLSLAGWTAPGFTGLYACANGGGGGGVVTANFGASAFTGTAPSGFTGSFPDSTTMVNAAAATQVALEQWAQGTPQAQLTQVGVEVWQSVGATAIKSGVYTYPITGTRAGLSGVVAETQTKTYAVAMPAVLTESYIAPPVTSVPQARVMVLA